MPILLLLACDIVDTHSKLASKLPTLRLRLRLRLRLGTTTTTRTSSSMMTMLTLWIIGTNCELQLAWLSRFRRRISRVEHTSSSRHDHDQTEFASHVIAISSRSCHWVCALRLLTRQQALLQVAGFPSTCFFKENPIQFT